MQYQHTPNPNLNKSSYSKKYENIIDYHKFYLINNNIVYKVLIILNKLEILIKIQNYEISVNEKDISALMGEKFESLDKTYKYILTLFEENRINITELNINKEIKLSFIYNNKEKEIKLSYNYHNEDIIFNEIRHLKKDITDLKNKIDALENEINYLKLENKKLKNDNNKKDNNNKDNNNKCIANSSNQFNLMIDLVADSYTNSNIDNSFVIFKSINNLFYLIYANISNSLICYDIEKKRKIQEIKNYHKEFISNFRHYLDKKNKRNLVMSISNKDNNIKILNINTWECCFDIKNVNKVGTLNSACFMNENSENFIISSNLNKQGFSEPIKIYNFKGEKIKEINDSNDSTLFIDTFYDKNTSVNYIITGNIGYVKSYKYNKNKVYHKYIENDHSSNFGHLNLIINDSKKETELIESCLDGNIRIWNFHSAVLLTKIKINNEGLAGICLWDNDYLLVGTDDSNTIKLIDLNKKLIVNSISVHSNKVITIKKIIHPSIGECIISQNFERSKIKLWSIKI